MKVFSSKSNRPQAYKFEKPTQTTRNSLGFDPIEFAVSLDGESWLSCYDNSNLDNVYCYDFDIPIAVQSDNLQKLGINDGQRIISSSYETRELKMSIVFHGLDENDTKLAINELQRFLTTRDGMWITWSNWGQRCYYVKLKQITPSISSISDFTAEIVFTDLIGLSRTIGDTSDLSNLVYGFGNKITRDMSYTFKNNSFDVYNPSDILIDPERRGHPLKIILSGSSNGGMKITNKTTGDYITRKGNWSGVWKLDGVNPYLNNTNDGINTDHGVITLQKGYNAFQVDNFTGSISFEFPFWYLS
ncbi:phage tail domain-containing protein [Ligilactobacillus salivarius]|uniref:phage tail domain-containing protein n=1 Tax=Ligilactobacillus salivarius TaxID=1624 RepID=UPI0033150B50